MQTTFGKDPILDADHIWKLEPYAAVTPYRTGETDVYRTHFSPVRWYPFGIRSASVKVRYIYGCHPLSPFHVRQCPVYTVVSFEHVQNLERMTNGYAV